MFLRQFLPQRLQLKELALVPGDDDAVLVHGEDEEHADDADVRRILKYQGPL